MLPYVENRRFFPTGFYQLFAGSAAMFFALHKRSTATYHIRDNNPDVVSFYRCLRDKPNELIAAIADLKRVYDAHNNKRGIFNFYRGEFNQRKRLPYEQSALLYCLPRLCFDSRLRYNLQGEFNSSFEECRDTIPFDAEQLRAASEHLQGTDIEIQDLSLIKPSEQDVVFLEPPHIGTNRDNTYLEPPTLEQLKTFLDSLPCRWVLSYGDCPEVHEAFSGCRFYYLDEAKNGLKRKGRKNILVVNSDDKTKARAHL